MNLEQYTAKVDAILSAQFDDLSSIDSPDESILPICFENHIPTIDCATDIVESIIQCFGILPDGIDHRNIDMLIEELN